MSFVIEKQESRLYIIAIRPPNFSDELTQFKKQIVEAIVRRPDGGVLFLDVTRASLLLPQIASGYTEIMKSDNAKVVRCALAARDDMLGQQVQRMVADAGSPKRRAFFDFAEAGRWLSEILTPAEKRALDTYLGVHQRIAKAAK